MWNIEGKRQERRMLGLDASVSTDRDGSFLLRFSSKPRTLTMCINSKGTIEHYHVVVNENVIQPEKVTDTKAYHTLDQFLAEYKEELGLKTGVQRKKLVK